MEKGKDSTKTSNSYVFKMSVPIFIELLLQMLVGNVDQILISHYSQNSVAAIGNANQILNIVIIVLSVMSVSTTVLISRYLGANDRQKISEVCNTAMYMLAIVSIIITALLFLFCNQILTLMKVPAAIFTETSHFLLIVGAFVIVQGLYMTFAAALRSYSLMKDVMIVAVIMNIVNIIGNIILIDGLLGFPELGIIGSAISTSLSRCLGLALVVYLFYKKTDARLSLKYVKPFPIKTMKNLLHIGLPSGLEEMSYNLSQVVIMTFVNMFGTYVITTKVYCSMFENVAYIYSIAIAQASQIVVSYLIGACRLKQANNRVWPTLWISMSISLTMTLVLYLNSDLLFGIFTHNPEILSLGKKILFVEFFLEIGRSINIVMVRCLIAVEDVKFPAIMCVGSSWLLGVGLGYIFGVKMGYGLVGVWAAMAMDECLRGFVFIFRFRSRGWAKKVHSKKLEERSIPVQV